MVKQRSGGGNQQELGASSERRRSPEASPGSYSKVAAYRDELSAQTQELVESQRELEASRERYRTLFEAMPVGYVAVQCVGNIVEANHAALTMLGLDLTGLLRRHFYMLVAPEDRGAYFNHRKRLFASRAPQTCEVRLQRVDGTYFEAHLHSDLRYAEDGNTTGYLSIIEDMSGRREAERGWRLADAVIEASVEGVVVFDADHRIVRVNESCRRLTGSGIDLLGGGIDRLLANTSANQDAPLLARALEAGDGWSGELWLQRRNSWPFPARAAISVLRDGRERITHYTLAFQDVTEARRTAEQLRQYAYYDSVTGLPNRTMFGEHLNQLAKEARRSGQLIGLLFLDLNRFKQINDTLGHAGGDELLQAVAARLANCVRESDIVARVGGDEFAILVPEIDSGEDANRIAEKIHRALGQYLEVQGTRLVCSSSIGIALFPRDAGDLETLFRYADLAMYRAKEMRRGGHRFYAPSMNAHALQRAALERELHTALNREQLELYYQPIYTVAGTEIVGAEALLRWRHPEHGLLTPSGCPFLRVAEETGQIGPVGDWVLQAACHAAAGWRARRAAAPFVSINVSPHQLQDPGCFQNITHALACNPADAAALRVEVTEHAAAGRDNTGAERLRSLRELGARLAMDDFGTGYSSLGYLRRLPFDCLKIDQGFVQELDTGAEGGRIVEAIISMAHALGLEVIAEGVETQAQCDCLRELACDYMQGHLFSEALPQAAFEQLIGAREAVAPAPDGA